MYLFLNNLERGETFSRFFIQKTRENLSKITRVIHALGSSPHQNSILLMGEPGLKSPDLGLTYQENLALKG